jgi:hypothetical protein
MPKYNADEQTQLAEPIQVTIDGKEYTVEKVPADLLHKVDDVAKTGGIDAPYQQLALLLGVDPTELMGADIRKIGAVLQFITDSIQEGVKKPKNS